MDYKLLNKFAHNKCYPNEVDEVFRWVQQSDVKSGELVFKQYWDKTPPNETTDAELIHRRLDKIHHRININQSEKPISGKRIKLPLRGAYLLKLLSKIAAILLIPVITLLIYTNLPHSTFIVNNEIVSPPGSRIFLELEDGTKVWLNQGSKLIYPQTFNGKNRSVTLVGEGYFEVAHDTSKPFIVESDGIQVKAVGTSFNVKAYNDSSDFETTLESGKVFIQKEFSGNESTVCEMHPGQHFRLNLKTNKYSLQNEKSFKYVAWKDGKLVFDDDSLSEVVDRLSQWYNVEIILKDPKLSELTCKATFVDESLTEILEMMQIIMPIHCVEFKRTKSDDGVFLKKKIFIYRKEH